MGQKVIRMEAKLLAVLSSGLPVNVSAVCAQLKVSRESFYKYRRRFEREGPAGLVERSRRPLRSPTMVGTALEDEIVRLRKDLPFENGAQTIAYHLARRGGPVPSVATIHRVLRRRGQVVDQPQKRPRVAWRRFEWPGPNDAWQIDATCWVLADETDVWIMDVLDDHSRVLVAARVVAGPTSTAAWDAFSHAVTEWGLPARVMSDNGVCFTGRFHGGEVDFERQLRDLGIEHLLSSPAHPQTCGKLERSHQSTKNWLRRQPAALSIPELQALLDEWRQLYNYDRPHKALGGATPIERWQAQAPATPGPPIPGARRTSLHRVAPGGTISWNRYIINLGTRLAGQHVLVIANDLDLNIHGQTGLIRQLSVDPTRRYQPSGRPPGRPPRPKP